MFIVSISYTADLTEVDNLIPEHIKFLDKYYEQGHFLVSGPKEPRTGGVILATAKNVEVLNAILAKDPFYQAGIADYEVTEFRPRKSAKGYENMLSIKE